MDRLDSKGRFTGLPLSQAEQPVRGVLVMVGDSGDMNGHPAIGYH